MIAKGASLGPYEIQARIGTGGMGEVWRARDQRIGRDVAVKILPQSLAGGDEGRLWRFEQEARAAGALNHPGLVTIFDVGTKDGAPYIVMELLEGQTLRETIGDPGPAPLPLRKAVDYAIQIATALAVAHDKGIIHRDLKPENIFVTSEGRVKILDFGLAKLVENGNRNTAARGLPRHMTSAGMVVGTPGYMSPEQVRAEAIDHRTDIFAFGSVLYEMLTGRPAFERSTAVETMHAILNDEPPSLTAVDPRIPAALDAIVFHCLEKTPRDRFQSARDLAFQLRVLPETASTASGVRAMPSGVSVASQSRRVPWRLIAIAAGVLALGAGGATWYSLHRAPASPGLRTFRQLTFADGLELFPTLAPDGKSFAYVSRSSGNCDIYLQRVDGRIPINLTADSAADDSEPAFSPDGEQIAFRSERDGGGIFVMGVTGESVRRLTDFGYNPAWSPDGTRLAVSTEQIGLRPHVRSRTGAELWIVDARSGAKRPLVQPGKGGPDFGLRSDAVQPNWSPRGNRIAFWGLASADGQRHIWTIEPDAPKPKETVVRVTTDPALQWNPVWSPDGEYLYFGSNRDGTLNLWRVPMDETSGRPRGPGEPVTLPASVSGNFAFSQTGDMVFTSATRSFGIVALPFDAATLATGAPRAVLTGSQEILSFDPSPDGRLVAFTMGGAQEDLFVSKMDGSHIRQLTNDAARDRDATWSPDGKTIYFQSNRDGAYRIWSIRGDGSGLTRLTDEGDVRRYGLASVYRPRISPDGRTLIVTSDRRGSLLLHLDRAAANRLEPVPEERRLDRWSPHGDRVLGGTRSGALFVFSPHTNQVDELQPKGLWPQWLPDGRRVVFFDGGRIGVVDLASRQETMAPFAAANGVQVDETTVLSRDGSTLYLRQRLEQGDIWLVQVQRGKG